MSTVLHSIFVTLSDPRPPSNNRLYRNGPHGRKVLSKEGAAFKAAMTAAVVRECMVLPWKQAVEAVYCEAAWVRLTIGLHVDLYNASWVPGALTPSGDLQSPYKKLDGSNYIKVIEDAVSDGTGIDDSANLSTTVEKIDGETYVEVAFEILSTRGSKPKPRGKRRGV
jgi:Holliday junction resolvase RusA-like endonuclease